MRRYDRQRRPCEMVYIDIGSSDHLRLPWQSNSHRIDWKISVSPSTTGRACPSTG